MHVPPACAQSSQAAPDAPHTVFVFPGWQARAVSQHPAHAWPPQATAGVSPGPPLDDPFAPFDRSMPPSWRPSLVPELPQAQIVATD
jgi:hypothetical protein